MASLKKSHASSGSSHSKAAKFKRYLPLYLMFLPGAIYLLINNPSGNLEEPVLRTGEFRISVCIIGCMDHYKKYVTLQSGVYCSEYSSWNYLCNLYL